MLILLNKSESQKFRMIFKASGNNAITNGVQLRNKSIFKMLIILYFVEHELHHEIQ